MESLHGNLSTVSGPSQDWIEAVRQSVASLRYGTVEIVVHDGSVTQIERAERMRFEKPPAAKPSGSSARVVDTNSRLGKG